MENRPHVIFDRLYNKGTTPRFARNKKTGEKDIQTFKGEFRAEWKCYLTRPGINDPYVWATPEYLMGRTTVDCMPVGFGGFEAIDDPNYPKEWREQLGNILRVLGPIVKANQQMRGIQNEQTKRAEQAGSDRAAGAGRARAQEAAGSSNS